MGYRHCDRQSNLWTDNPVVVMTRKQLASIDVDSIRQRRYLRLGSGARTGALQRVPEVRYVGLDGGDPS